MKLNKFLLKMCLVQKKFFGTKFGLLKILGCKLRIWFHARKGKRGENWKCRRWNEGEERKRKVGDMKESMAPFSLRNDFFPSFCPREYKFHSRKMLFLSTSQMVDNRKTVSK